MLFLDNGNNIFTVKPEDISVNSETTSEVPNTRANRNKRAGWYFLRNLLTSRPE